MKEIISTWRHVFKLDPDRDISDEDLDLICSSNTDGLIVGGTTGVTYENTIDLLSRIRRYPVPAVLEISHPESIVPGFDGFLIPLVLNAQDPDWLFNPHIEALKQFGPIMKWEEIMVEGYIVLNKHSSVAQVTKAKTDMTLDECVAYGRLADQLLNLPIVYMEYSGEYGNPKWVEQIRSKLKSSRLIYGGGIRSASQAQEMAQHADTVVIGNIIYEDIETALQTVDAVKNKGV